MSIDVSPVKYSDSDSIIFCSVLRELDFISNRPKRDPAVLQERVLINLHILINMANVAGS